MRTSVLAVAAAMLLAMPAFAQVESPPPPESAGIGVSEHEAHATTETTAPGVTEEQASAAPEAEAELVCRNISSRTESRLRSRRERVCKTQAEWDRQEAPESRTN